MKVFILIALVCSICISCSTFSYSVKDGRMTAYEYELTEHENKELLSSLKIDTSKYGVIVNSINEKRYFDSRNGRLLSNAVIYLFEGEKKIKITIYSKWDGKKKDKVIFMNFNKGIKYQLITYYSGGTTDASIIEIK